MKKLVAILLTLFSFTPALVLADAGGANQGVVTACTSYNCACTGMNDYIYNDPTIADAEACAARCDDITNNQFSDYERDQAGILVPDYQCLDANGKVVVLSTAASSGPITIKKATILPNLNVKIPGLCDMSPTGKCWGGISTSTDSSGTEHSSLIGSYVSAVYLYALGAASLIAVTMLMIAGLQYATARGDSKQVDQAKKRISNAVVGVILLLLGYNIAFLIDPATTTFNSLSIQHIDPILYIQQSGDTTGSTDYSSVTPPPGVICDQKTDLFTIANSFKGHVSYRLGGKAGGQPPYADGADKVDSTSTPYSSYCPPDQLCLDCSGYAGYLAYCAGLPSANEGGGTAAIFAGAEKVSSCTSVSVNDKLLNPGDLLGWAPADGVHGHVLTYIGNGRITDAHGSGRDTGRGVGLYDLSFACNNFMNQSPGLFVVRKTK